MSETGITVDEFRQEIFKIVVESLSFDPNYTYDNDNEDAMDIDDEKDGSVDDDVSDYSDDGSWDVRRAAAQCILAIIKSRNYCLHEKYITFGRPLINCFSERADYNKQDILNAYIELLQQTSDLLPDRIMPYTLNNIHNEQEQFSLEKFLQFIHDKDYPMRKKIFEEIDQQIPVLIRRLCSVQKTKNVKVLVLENTFVLLGTLLCAYPGSLGSQLQVLARGINISLDSEGMFKTYTVQFLCLFFATHRFEDYCQNIPLIIDDMLKLMSDSSSNVASKAIEAVSLLIRSMTASSKYDMEIVEKIDSFLVERLKVTNMDQEIEDKTIAVIGFFISGFGDKVESSLEATLSLLCERVGYQNSCEASIKAMTIIARSKKSFKIKSVIHNLVVYLPEYLRGTYGSLKTAVLELILALTDREEDVISEVYLNETIAEITMLLKDSDPNIAELALQLTKTPNFLGKAIMAGAHATDERARISAAHCLSSLAKEYPDFLSALLQLYNSSDNLARSCALIAFRFMIQDQPLPADDQLASILPNFLIAGVKDDDIKIRCLTIMLLNTIAHHKPNFIRKLLGSLLPDIYLLTHPRPEDQVKKGSEDLADEGLELRKSAFECLYSLTEHCMGQLPLGELIIRIQNGLNDHHDIKQLSYLTIIRLSEICPLRLARHVEKILEIMKNQLLIKPTPAVKLEDDKHEEIKRCVIKALLAMKNMKDLKQLNAVEEFYNYISSTPELSVMMNEIRSENSSR
uniref:TATA-binding protein interacting (TIP20) domain-containing protein n=2 Tax=Panagrolaimus sp. JU765 TaxID=591449 RepID=A0AC34QHQ5_9BILA